MGKKVRISNESVNSYGFRVLTSGMDVEQFRRNPVLLYMHQRGQVVGYVKNIEVKDDEVTGELEFDCATELSKRCKAQFDFGSLRMVSAGLEVLATDDSPETAVPGQTQATVTRCRLDEVSVVDIGANDDAIVLTREGRRVCLSAGHEDSLPSLREHLPEGPQKPKEEMELKTIALTLGLPETATEAEVEARIAVLAKAESENESMRLQREQAEQAEVERLVGEAVAQHRIGEDRRETFVQLGREVGSERLRGVLEAMQPQVRLSTLVNTASEGKEAPSRYERLSQVAEEDLVRLRKEQPEEYKRLYEAEYGFVPKW